MIAGREDAVPSAGTDFERSYWRNAPAVAGRLGELAAGAVGEDEFRLLADNLPILCWIANGDGYIVWYNRRWHEYTGTTPAEMEGWGWQSVHDPEVLPSVMEGWTASIATGEPFEMTFPLKGADGRFRPFLTRVQPVRDSSAEVVRWFGVNTEIGSQLAAEEALRIERDRSAGVLQHMAEGFALLDRDFRIVAINAEGVRLDGRPREEIVGKTHWEAYPEAVELAALYRKAMAERVPVSLEHCYAFENGRKAWLEMRAHPAPDGGLAIFYRDISGRKAADEALREREERLRLVVDGATDYAIVTTDPERRITSWSQGAARIFGYSPEEAIGRSADMIFTPEDRAAGAPEREAQAALETGCADDRRWHLRADGSLVYMNGSMHPLPRDADGRERGFIKIARDETERAGAERALRESEERLRLVQAAGGVGSFDYDLQKDEAVCSREYYEMLGLEQGHPINRESWSAAIHPEDREQALHALESAIEERRPFAFEYRIVRGDTGEVRWLSGRGAMIFDSEGRPWRYVGGNIDVTERRRTEEKLRELNETLEQRVAEEIERRSATEEALRQSQKMEAIGQLTGGIAHDFNNLLTVILGSAEILQRPDLAEEKRGRYVSAIAETAGRAAKLTSQLLAFARRQALEPTVFDAAERIRAVTEMLRPVMGSRIDVRIEAEGSPCHVNADPNQFDTAILNMSVNARDAMEGEGRLTIGVAAVDGVPAQEGGGAAAEGAHVAVSLTDNGAGIPADQVQRIFEPFFTTKPVGQGTGLGLSQVFGFAKQSGGEIRVSSKAGEGSTFTLYLPKAEAPENTAGAAPASAAARGGGRILVVEDNPQVGEFARQLLEDLGYETIWAPDAECALELLGREEVDLVFTDVVMPGMSGVELAKRLRRSDPDLPVVLTSGYSHVLAEEGAHGFPLLHKPYSVEALSDALAEQLAE
jgi:PAS domain S-box-containing protein